MTLERLPYFWGGGLQIHDSNITTSNIDFSGDYTATNLNDPLNPFDVANKEYVDRVLRGLDGNSTEIIELTDVGPSNATLIDIVPKVGACTLLVTSMLENGPVARFNLFSSTPSRGDIAKDGQSGGDGTKGGYIRLHVLKDSTTGGYYLYKTCDNLGDEDTFDGSYKIVATISSSLL